MPTRTVFVRLKDGSLSELQFKIDLAREFGGSSIHKFYRTNCRMRIASNGAVTEDLVAILTEIEDDPASARFITFAESHQFAIKHEAIIGIVHPADWSFKGKDAIDTDYAALEAIHQEYGIPILPNGSVLQRR